MGRKKRVAAVILAIVILAAGIGAYKGFEYYKTLKDYRQRIETMKISNVDLEKVPDGSYTGSAEAIWVAAEVKVEVRDHRIVKVDLLSHKNGKGLSAEVITQKVVEAQSLEVDVISGATSSSKVILKAIENALNSAQK